MRSRSVRASSNRSSKWRRVSPSTDGLSASMATSRHQCNRYSQIRQASGGRGRNLKTAKIRLKIVDPERGCVPSNHQLSHRWVQNKAACLSTRAYSRSSRRSTRPPRTRQLARLALGAYGSDGQRGCDVLGSHRLSRVAASTLHIRESRSCLRSRRPIRVARAN